MIVFPSTLSVQIITTAVIVILLWLGTGRQPFDPVYRFLHSLVTSRKFLIFFAATIAILIVNTYEVKLENVFGVSYDLTSVLAGWEGSWQASLQSLMGSKLLTAFCTFFYVVMFQSVMIASIGVYTMRRDKTMYYAFCVSLLINYAVAVPMYWFVPVNEAWYVRPEIRFLMLDSFPGFEQNYRGLSGLNNCFPSLHTSISVTMALLASRSGIRRWAVICWINAVVIIFSIFYLGIHWFTDMIGGLALAYVSVALAMKAGARAEGNLPASAYAETRKKAFPTG